MKNIIMPAAIIPMLTEVIVGTLLFILGVADDAPGLSLLGLAVAFLLITRGIYKTGMITNGVISPIIAIYFGLGGLLFSVILLFDGEFGGLPWLAIVGVALGIGSVLIGVSKLCKLRAEH